MQLLYGFILAIIIALLAYRAHSLNRSGALAAAFTGTIIFGVGGWQWAVLLLTFFITSSGLSRAFKKRKIGLNEKYSKGHERDMGQVFGNGGIATLFAALHGIRGCARRCQRGHVGDRTRCAESESAAHDYQFAKSC
jgi:uncharacterized membrane protein